MSSISVLDPFNPKVEERFQVQKKRSCTHLLSRIVFAPVVIAKGAFHCFRNIAQSALQPHIYPASSEKFKEKLDVDRLEQSREVLRSIGGQTVALQTTDGDWLEAMYFDVENFKRAMMNKGGRFIVTPSGKQFLRSYSDELTTILGEAMKLDGTYVNDPDVIDDQVFQVELSDSTSTDPQIFQKQAMILTQGNRGIFEMNRSSVIATLLKGQSCVTFNIRGTGRSHGKPNEERSYRDIEAVYLFLQSKGFSSNQICVWGYCLGAGLAVELASQYPIHLILDRPFAKIGDVAVHFARAYINKYIKVDLENPKIKGIVDLVTNISSSAINLFIISYDNLSKLPRVKGSIFYVHSDEDGVIPEGSRNKMREALKRNELAIIQTSDAFEHGGPWDSETEQIHETYLRKNGMFRRYPNTAAPPLISLGRLIRRPLLCRKQVQSIQASVLLGGASLAWGPPGAVLTAVTLGAAAYADSTKKRSK